MTDVRSRGSLYAARNVSFREKDAGNASSSSHSDRQEVDNVSQNSAELQKNENDSIENSRIDSRVTRSTNVTSMELQTYKPLMPLLPAEVDHVEETPPASIFVIEVDVNHIVSVHETMDEELMEASDKA